jgi:hypothetical protein
VTLDMWSDSDSSSSDYVLPAQFYYSVQVWSDPDDDGDDDDAYCSKCNRSFVSQRALEQHYRQSRSHVYCWRCKRRGMRPRFRTSSTKERPSSSAKSLRIIVGRLASRPARSCSGFSRDLCGGCVTIPRGIVMLPVWARYLLCWIGTVPHWI